jgi:hypothetical protein
MKKGRWSPEHNAKDNNASGYCLLDGDFAVDSLRLDRRGLSVGFVLDQSKAVIPGAEVSATNAEAGVISRTTVHWWLF